MKDEYYSAAAQDEYDSREAFINFGNPREAPLGSTLYSLNLFYKNDIQDGFGTGLTPYAFENNPGLAKQIINMSQATIKYYEALKTKEERAQCIAESWEQLEDCRDFFVKGRLKHTSDLTQSIEIITPSNQRVMNIGLALDNLSFLESLGLLVSDEYNGVVWMWESH